MSTRSGRTRAASGGDGEDVDTIRLLQRLLRVAQILGMEDLRSDVSTERLKSLVGSTTSGLSQQPDRADGTASNRRTGPELDQNDTGTLHPDDFGEDDEDVEYSEDLEDGVGGVEEYGKDDDYLPDEFDGEAAQSRALKRKTAARNIGPAGGHAAVEKRYRTVVNGKIQQLHDLIRPVATPGAQEALPLPRRQVQSGHGKGPAGTEVPSKPVVLDSANKHICQLVQTYEHYEAEEARLRRQLQQWLQA